MVGANVIAAETDAAARRLFTSAQQAFTNLFRGARGQLLPPIDDIETYWTPLEKAQASSMLACSFVGAPATVRDGLERFAAETGADEVIVASAIYEHAARLRSYEILADAFDLTRGALAKGHVDGPRARLKRRGAARHDGHAADGDGEILAGLGFDWLSDGEHGPETRELAAILRPWPRHACPCACRSGEVPIRGADLGARASSCAGEHLASAADVVRFRAPDARRGLARGAVGMPFKEYVEVRTPDRGGRASGHARAVDNIGRSRACRGRRSVTDDLAASLGKMGQVDDPIVVAAIRRVTEACAAAGMPLGYFGVTAAAVAPYVERGYTLIVAGVDTLFLGQAARTLLADLRKVSG
jgi:hypothetical protein